MNCLEFRRKLHEDPRCAAPDFTAHLRACASCRREHQRVLCFDEQLREALEVEPPADLAQRILAAQRAEAAPARRQRPWRMPAALAATLVLGVGVALFISGIWTPRPDDGLETTVLHHIRDELPHLHEVRDVTPERLAALLEDLGGALREPLHGVNFAGKCQMRKYPGAHLVLAGERGPVTVLIMPGERIAAARRFHSERFVGELVPTRYGSFAVVGEKGEDTDAIAGQIARDIVWRS